MTRTRRFGRLRRAAARRRTEASRPEAASPRLTLLLLSLPGLAAVAALLFTWLQVGQTGKELRISEEGQITTRFNAAIDNLGSGSTDVRLGGIYALERIMKDSAADQPAVASVLSAYVRRHAPLPATAPAPPPDVSAAPNVLVRRRPDRDGGLMVDLSGTALPNWKPTYAYQDRSVHLRNAVPTGSDLSGVDLAGADLAGARFDGARLTGARLADADLSEALFDRAKLGDADLIGANLTGASFDDADLAGAALARASLQKAYLARARLSGTNFERADLREATFCVGIAPCSRSVDGVNLAGADLAGAALEALDLRKVRFCDRETLVLHAQGPARGPAATGTEPDRIGCASLRGAFLNRANLSGVDLKGADLRDAWLLEADLSRANLSGADLTGTVRYSTRFDGADLTGAKGIPADATGHPLPQR
ncbi:pentapeptide repeat-containing protein [Streptomyces sp. NPDC094032]|uniref:pentapeptide repeat-containing protein n=1 Tax=Streptomyces sp. NPDC094032 TaxID=3155308 RepID=UPI0033272ACA